MLVGQGTTSMVFESILAWQLTKTCQPAKANQYLSMIRTTADYFLGCNPLNTNWITGLGLRRPERVFHMDSWYNGKNEPAPGITPYGPWRDDSGFTGQGAWDVCWPYKSIYPASIGSWPGHERWFGNSTCPLNAEFTVHQNTILNAAVYGFLCNTTDGSFKPNNKPLIGKVTVRKLNTTNDSLIIWVESSDPDGDQTLYKAELFKEWHLAAQTTGYPFQFKLAPAPGQINFTLKITDILGAQTTKQILFRTDTLTTSFSPEQKSSIKVFPNPHSGEFHFSIPLKNNSGVSLAIYSEERKQVEEIYSEHVNDFQFTWNPKIHGLPGGVYVYCIKISGEIKELYSGKLIYNSTL